MAITFNRRQFDEALELVEKAKFKGLKNLGLIKIKLEMDALRKLIANAYKGAAANGQA